MNAAPRITHCAVLFLVLASFTLSLLPYNALAGEAHISRVEKTIEQHRDPLQKFNRYSHEFNDMLDRYLLKPVARVYRAITPKFFRRGVDNVFNNLGEIPTIINDGLQLNLRQTLSDSWRFGINSTLGIGGLFDVASGMGLEPNEQDLGLTFARWGYRDSAYFVIPFLGPSTIRDALALPFNFFYFTFWHHIESVRLRNQLFGLDLVNERAGFLKSEDAVKAASLDNYVFIRDAYLQRRNYMISGVLGKNPEDPFISEEDDTFVPEEDPLTAKDTFVPEDPAPETAAPAQE